MKSIKYIIVPALVGMLFTACNNVAQGPSQADMDAQVDAKVKAATDNLKTDCDNRLLQAAQLKADSILAKTSTKKVVTHTAPAPKPATPAPKHTPAPTPKHTTPKTEGEKVKGLFDKKTQAENAKQESGKVKEIFKNEGHKTEKEIKKEEDKVKSLFNK